MTPPTIVNSPTYSKRCHFQRTGKCWFGPQGHGCKYIHVGRQPKNKIDKLWNLVQIVLLNQHLIAQALNLNLVHPTAPSQPIPRNPDDPIPPSDPKRAAAFTQTESLFPAIDTAQVKNERVEDNGIALDMELKSQQKMKKPSNCSPPRHSPDFVADPLECTVNAKRVGNEPVIVHRPAVKNEPNTTAIHRTKETILHAQKKKKRKQKKKKNPRQKKKNKQKNKQKKKKKNKQQSPRQTRSKRTIPIEAPHSKIRGDVCKIHDDVCKDNAHSNVIMSDILTLIHHQVMMMTIHYQQIMILMEMTSIRMEIGRIM
eukprot:609538_1